MRDHRSPGANRLALLLRDLLIWLAASLLAIVALESSPPLGFALTVLGGVCLGILIVRGHLP